MRAPGALDRLAVDLLRPGPALRRAEDDRRPRLAFVVALLARRVLELRDPVERVVEHVGEAAVQLDRILLLEAAGEEEGS